MQKSATLSKYFIKNRNKYTLDFYLKHGMGGVLNTVWLIKAEMRIGMRIFGMVKLMGAFRKSMFIFKSGIISVCPLYFYVLLFVKFIHFIPQPNVAFPSQDTTQFFKSK